ncbi:MAG TPA: class I tRNA ligase family protein, partial [Gaiellaceae bacterium]|nr:class I tRNA ligase family protein [Gaiellaceae bacterium]
MDRYEPAAIEAKWQKVWEDEQTFHTPDPAPGDEPPNHWYQLEMLPYPSGTLHMGHVLNYSMGDVLTHFRRRSGWSVLRPMGWDSFGLPAENAAIREGGHPREIVERNIVDIRRQMKRLGWVIDWQREVGAHEPDFYRWTQWLFIRFFERGLAYRKAAPVNWCPFDQTVVANEYVIDGHCERCGTLVELRNLEQWFFKITAYADELLRFDLPEGGSWPERTITIQRNWIGRSEGAEILFRVDELDTDIPVFTTRPDTLYGATFFVLAPEHPLIEKIANEEVAGYVKQTARKKTEERAAEEAKTGVFTGLYATNPVNGARIPIWVADYVLMDYGTGAIMAVPAHDERDRGFAETFELPAIEVISEDGVLVNSAEFDGMPAEEAKKAIVDKLHHDGLGAPAV